MNRKRINGPAVSVLVLTLLLNSCGGGAASIIVDSFIPVFINQWKGVNSDFQLVEYQFSPSAENVATGTFIVADSTVSTADTSNNQISLYDMQGSFNERTFTFDTLDSTGAIVGSFSGRFIDRDTIEITPTNPAGSPYRLHQIVDQVTFIPSIESAWGDDQSTLVLNLNENFFDGSEAAFFTGSDQTATDVFAVEGYFVADNVFIRRDPGGNPTEFTGNFIGADSIRLGGRTLSRGGIVEASVLYQANPGGGSDGLYLADAFNREFTVQRENVDDTWVVNGTGDQLAVHSFVGVGTVSTVVLDNSTPAAAVVVSAGLEISSTEKIEFSPDGQLLAWSGLEPGSDLRRLFVGQAGVESSAQRVSGDNPVNSRHWSWSPGSLLVAYSFGNGATRGVAAYDVALQAPVALGFPAGTYEDVVWSPTGSFVSARNTETGNVFIARADGSPAVPANRNLPELSGAFTWVPDETAANDNYVYESVAGTVSNLYLADAADASNDRALTSNVSGQFDRESVSPLGTYVAYGKPGIPSGDDNLFVVNISTAAESSFVQGSEQFYAFSPADDLLVYSQRLQGQSEVRLFAAEVESTAQSELISPVANAAGAVQDLTWSTNLDYIAVVKAFDNRTDSVLVAGGLAGILPATIEMQDISGDPVDSEDRLNLRWTSDSQRILYTAERNRINRPDAISVARNGLGRLALRNDDIGTGVFWRIETLP